MATHEERSRAESSAVSTLVPPVEPIDHVVGRSDAAVTLLEYGDYECPFCARAHLVVNEVLEAMASMTRFAFRQFPLTHIHPHALVAAQAAEAAGAQGRFWEMHDMLFENQDALSLETILRCASALDLDVERIVDDLRNGVHLRKVKRDFESGTRSGANGTPTFFINDSRLQTAWDPEHLVRAIQAAASRDRTARP